MLVQNLESIVSHIAVGGSPEVTSLHFFPYWQVTRNPTCGAKRQCLPWTEVLKCHQESPRLFLRPALQIHEQTEQDPGRMRDAGVEDPVLSFNMKQRKPAVLSSLGRWSQESVTPGSHLCHPLPRMWAGTSDSHPTKTTQQKWWHLTFETKL